MSIEANFREAMLTARIETEAPVVADGKLHRFHVIGDRSGTRNGWFVLHLGPPPAGAYGSNKTGFSTKWRAGTSAPLTQSARAAMDADRAAQHLAESLRHEQVAATAARFVATLPPADPSHPYLIKKGVGPNGILQCDDLLVIPICDVSCAITSYQTISPAGDKRFLSGGRISGNFFTLGRPLTRDITHVVICEGVATGMSLHECSETSGALVVVAFNACNLIAVATAIRLAYPTIALSIAADWDGGPDGGIGVAKAIEAADAVDAELWVPLIPDAMRMHKADFNDLAQWQRQQRRAA